MKKFLLYLISVLLFTACANEIPNEEPVVRKGRTILAYLVANNKAGIDMDSYLKQNIQWMYESMSAMKDSCRLLVYYRPNTDDKLITAPSIFEFVSDGQGNINQKIKVRAEELDWETIIKNAVVRKIYDEPNHNATDPQVMKQVFKDMLSIFPAESYGLIFGSHATGWMPAKQTVGRAFGDDNAYSIDIPQLSLVLQESFSQENLDFILFDACMMGTTEVAYELKDVVDYCIYSVMETPIMGFPYQTIFPYLMQKDINFQGICSAFTDYYEKNWGTCAVVDCSKADELANAIQSELRTHAEDLETFDYEKVQQYGKGSYENFSFDVADFITLLNDNSTIEPVDFQKALDQFVVAKSCVPASQFRTVHVDENRFCGVGMYLPGAVLKNNTWEEYYRTSLSWYQAAGWSELEY